MNKCLGHPDILQNYTSYAKFQDIDIDVSLFSMLEIFDQTSIIFHAFY